MDDYNKMCVNLMKSKYKTFKNAKPLFLKQPFAGVLHKPVSKNLAKSTEKKPVQECFFNEF